jgi:hypothetical protein
MDLTCSMRLSQIGLFEKLCISMFFSWFEFLFTSLVVPAREDAIGEAVSFIVGPFFCALSPTVPLLTSLASEGTKKRNRSEERELLIMITIING